MTIKKIISGGQTGVDRAALDVALELGIPCGGWIPADRMAEDGPISDKYPMWVMKSGGYRKRTEKNVKDSDGTLIINIGELSGGTLLTINLVKKHNMPCLIIDLEKPEQEKGIIDRIQAHHIKTLNIAGPEEIKRPGNYKATLNVLTGIFNNS